MSLVELRKEVSQAAEKQIREINKQADNEAKAILAKAEGEASQAISMALEQAKALAKEEERKISSAHLHAKRIVAEVREEMISSSIQLAREKLEAEAEKQSPAYQKLFERLAKKGVQEFGDKAVISCRKQDALLAKELVDSVKAIDCSGGLIVSSANGKVQLDYTFDSILEENRDEYKQIAFTQLFSDKRVKQGELEEVEEKPAKHVTHAHKPVSKHHSVAGKKK